MTLLTLLTLLPSSLLLAIDEPPAAEDIKPGWIALVTVMALGVATVLLWLSMRKRLGKIHFDERTGPGDDGPPAGTGTGGG